MLPPAPARFSTTTCCPRFSPSVLATMRATVSVPPPGSKPTTIVTGLLGKLPCADAVAANMSPQHVEINLMSPSFENRLSLLHEGLSALGVILALEALPDPCLAERGVVILLQHLADDALRGAHGERRVGGDLAAVFVREALQIRDRHDMVHQADLFRLGGGELPPGDHDLARIGGADRIHQVLHGRGAVAQAHLRRRDAEARVVAGDPEVADVGDVDAGAQAVAADHGEHRLVERLQARLRGLGDLLVALHRFLARALVLELRDVGARDERLVAGSGEHDDPHLLIRFKFCKNGGDGLPHVDRDGVAALGIVEDQPADGAFLLRDDALGHQTTPRCRRPVMSLSLYPSSFRISSVCAPRSGVGVFTAAGVRDSFTAWLSTLKRPSFGCSTAAATPRCCTCGSANTWSTR